jgi:hypothetical protein
MAFKTNGLTSIVNDDCIEELSLHKVSNRFRCKIQALQTKIVNKQHCENKKATSFAVVSLPVVVAVVALYTQCNIQRLSCLTVRVRRSCDAEK